MVITRPNDGVTVFLMDSLECRIYKCLGNLILRLTFVKDFWEGYCLEMLPRDVTNGFNPSMSMKN